MKWLSFQLSSFYGSNVSFFLSLFSGKGLCPNETRSCVVSSVFSLNSSVSAFHHYVLMMRFRIDGSDSKLISPFAISGFPSDDNKHHVKFECVVAKHFLELWHYTFSSSKHDYWLTSLGDDERLFFKRPRTKRPTQFQTLFAILGLRCFPTVFLSIHLSLCMMVCVVCELFFPVFFLFLWMKIIPGKPACSWKSFFDKSVFFRSFLIFTTILNFVAKHRLFPRSTVHMHVLF